MLFNSQIHIQMLKSIVNAKIYDFVEETALEPMSFLSNHLNNNILIKREDLHPVHSFKIRGAYNKIKNLSDQKLKDGILTVSAGNHAQGVALAAKKLKAKAVIVMPKTTPDIKIQSVKRFGVQIELFGNTFNEAKKYAMNILSKSNYTFVPPFDDEEVIIGQGTIGQEILKQAQQTPDYIFVPIGGGGLISGIALYIKFFNPAIKIIGVEPEGNCAMFQSIKAGRILEIKSDDIFADGVAVSKVGDLPFAITSELVDEIITVTNDEICAAIKDIFYNNRAIAEPASASAVAGLKKYVAEKQLKNKNLIAINTGANLNFSKLRFIAERTELGEKTEIILAVTLAEKPGTFLDFCTLVGKHPITEFNYRFHSFDKPANVFVGIKISSISDKEKIINQLQTKDYQVVDLSEDEMAKAHIRYMVGGRLNFDAPKELIFRVRFPERPSALLNFLNKFNLQVNISMFHYRNIGADSSSVLLGVQANSEQKQIVIEKLNSIGYPFTEETNSRSYDFFLK